MTIKITLITPPDIFQNNQDSILFMGLTDIEQDHVSEWLASTDRVGNINIYFYSGEPNVDWLMHALAASTFRYIRLNNTSAITERLAGYILSKPNVYYSTDDNGLAELYSFVNVNRVNNAVDFLERVFSGT